MRMVSRLVSHFFSKPISFAVDKPFFILGSQRTGSNWLQEILNNHDDCICFGEYLNPGKGKVVAERFFELSQGKVTGPTAEEIRTRPLSSMVTLFQDVGREVQESALGFRLFYDHLTQTQHRRLARTLRVSGEFKIVHLKRKNILRSLVSREIAKIQGKWLLRENEGPRPVGARTISIDPRKAMKFVEQINMLRKKTPMIYRGLPVLDVWYEDLAARPDEQVSIIYNFLGLSPGKPNFSLRRMNPEPIAALIDNFRELALQFQNTPWGWMVEEGNGSESMTEIK